MNAIILSTINKGHSMYKFRVYTQAEPSKITPIGQIAEVAERFLAPTSFGHSSPKRL
jgi:hypothetical protein